MTATAMPHHQSAPNHVGHSRLHLTQRGRLVLLGIPVLLATVALLSAVLFFSTSALNNAQATQHSAEGVAAVQVTVSAGDTLWSVASEATTGGNVRQTMAQIAELNDLDSAQLQPGDVLHVPSN